MKKNRIKTLLVCSFLPFVASCSSISDPDISISIEEDSYFNVNFPSNMEGYLIFGSSKAKANSDYSFSVSIKDGYDGTSLKVMANGTELSSSNNIYTISNVTSDISISVTGVVAISSLTLKNSSYKFYLGHIDENKKTKEYFLDGVSGYFKGNKCDIDVDISSLDFNSIGTYEITYSLVGHEEINKRVKVVILDNPSKISDISIDISSIYEHEIVPRETFGEANLDFFIYNGDYQLASEDLFSSNKHNGNYLSKTYLKKLSLGKHTFKIAFTSDLIQEFDVSLVDEKGPNYSFDVTSNDICFVKGSLSLPSLVVNEDSIQEIESSYLLDGESKSKEEIVEAINNVEGDYNYSIIINYNNSKYEEKTYSIHMRDEYIPFTFASSGSKFASSYYSNSGNPLLSLDYASGDTNIMLDESYIASNNTEAKKYVFIAFRVITNSSSGSSLWNRDPEICFDSNGNYVPTSVNPKYNGQDIASSGSLMYKTFALNGNKFENDVWIMRGFSGSIEILKIEFCDLDYVDPIVDIEATKSKLSSFNTSFGTIWDYIHVGAVGSAGGASLGGNCIDIQPSLFKDLKKCSYQGVKLKIKVNDRTDIKKMECWIFNESHVSSFDGIVDESGYINVDVSLKILENRVTSSNNVMFYFSTSASESASSYDELRNDSSGNYVSSANFVISSIELY